ncbi:ribonuclease P protein component [Mycoplasmoides genitalium]
MSVKNSHSLRERKVFTTILQSKTRFFGTFINAYFIKNNHSTWRVAISIAKTKYKLAVQRNLIKRQIRSIFQQISNNLEPWDILVIVNKGFIELTFKEKQKLFLQLLKRIKEVDAYQTSANK